MPRLPLPLILLLCLAALANPDGIPVTRLAEGAPPLETYAQYLTHRTPPGAADFSTVFSDRGPGDDLLVIVNSTLYPQITANLTEWMDTLESEGYAVTLVTSGVVTPQALKTEIASHYCDGVVLIGDYDSAWYEMDASGWGHEEFPCDYYLMDLDGEWTDTDADGLYDTHEDGTGDMDPEIYLGRVTAHNLPICGSEADLVNAWLARVVEFKNGDSTLPHNSLSYVDNDWSSWGASWGNAVSQVYATNEIVYDPYETTADDYRLRLADQDLEHMLVCVHSSPLLHQFYYGDDSWANLTNSEVQNLDPQWSIANLFACSNIRYTTDNYMGGVYAFGGTAGLLSIGSTKTGSMLFFQEYYGAIADGESYGEAFSYWMGLVGDGDYGGYTQEEARAWFYGMTLIGDPTLEPSADSPVEVADFRAAPAEGGALVSWSICSGISGVNLYRLEDSTRVRLNSELLPASSGRYLDREVPGSVGSWLLEVVDDSGETVTFGPTECEIYGEDLAVSRLAGVYPNPVTGPAAVSLELAGRDAGRVELALYDTAGRRVATVYSGSLPAGHHTLALPSENLAAGVYLLQLQTTIAQATARVLVSR